jgi:uncharacterized protein involved in outer membrane biogenesis
MKWVKRLIILIVVLVVVVLLGVFMFLDSIVKKGVETVGPAVTKVDVKLGSAKISPLSGSGELKNFVVANPEGFKSPTAIQVGSIGVSVVPTSVMGDKVVVRYVRVESPEITFEGSLTGDNNLSKILENVQGTEKKKPETKEETKAQTRKLQVDDFLISGAKVRASVVGQTITVPLPEIHLTGLGQGPEGITPAELISKVLTAVTKETIQAVGNAAANVGKEAIGGVKSIGTNAVGTFEKGVKGFFNKK